MKTININVKEKERKEEEESMALGIISELKLLSIS